jgi:hypothetical protein
MFPKFCKVSMSLVGELAASVPNKLSGRYCNLHDGMLVKDAPVEEVGRESCRLRDRPSTSSLKNHLQSLLGSKPMNHHSPPSTPSTPVLVGARAIARDAPGGER